MKNKYAFKLVFMITLFNFGYIFGHSERVHQYIAREGYKLLKLYLGSDIPQITAHMGTNETNGYIGWNSRGSDFQSDKIVCGAFREDVRDVVWGYGNSSFPGVSEFLSYSYASVTHFWDADLGDDYLTNFMDNPSAPVPYSDIPNAYQKIVTYANGGWILELQINLYGFPTHSDGTGSCAAQSTITHLKYNSLVDLYTNKNIWVTEVTWTGTGQTTTYNTPIKLESHHWYSQNSFSYSELFEHLTWEILGRMVHLVGDMSVPAHTHNDAHPWADEETYEKQYMHIDTDDDPYSNPNVNYWNAQSVWNMYGNIMNPYVSNDSPLHHLMYSVNQITDHFASYHYDGDDYKVNNNPELNSYFPWGIAPTSTVTYNDPYPPYTKSILHKNIRDATFPHVIRATAGLLYWFAVEANLEIKTPSFTVNPTVNNLGTVYGGYAQINSTFNIFNDGETPLTLTIKTTNPYYDLNQDTWQKDSEINVTLNKWQSKTIAYEGVAPLYAGAFTEVITIDDNTYNLHKTHTITGTVPIPDFCFGETNARSSSPEEQLFDDSFNDKFWELDSLSAKEQEKLTPKEKMSFAYEMFELSDKDPVSKACIQSIDTYPSTEMDMSFYALNVLWESSLKEPSSKEFNIDDFKKYLMELTNRKEKHRVYGYAELILSLLEEEGRLKRLDNVYNNYSDSQLEEISLFQQFIYYFIEKDTREKAQSITKQMDKEFPNSKYAYQTHIMLGDNGYTLKGLKELMDKNEKKYLAKRALGKNNSTETMPTEYELFQNYPNPFNPTTTINYTLPQSAFVKLNIYNTMGQLVKTLVSEYKSAGSYNIIWNSTNQNEELVSSGTYFYVLKIAEKVFTKKMILLR